MNVGERILTAVLYKTTHALILCSENHHVLHRIQVKSLLGGWRDGSVIKTRVQFPASTCGSPQPPLTPGQQVWCPLLASQGIACMCTYTEIKMGKKILKICLILPVCKDKSRNKHTCAPTEARESLETTSSKHRQHRAISSQNQTQCVKTSAKLTLRSTQLLCIRIKPQNSVL